MAIENKNKGAFACSDLSYQQPGLTKREYFAGLAMQSYAGGEYTGQSGMPHNQIAEWSVGMADALLDELNK
jgi:hypothetical protein